jgi:preflagellin peptidase FlaK
MGTDAARLFVGSAILGYASWTDWRWRRAPDLLWVLLAASGILLAIVDFLAVPGAVPANGGAYLAAALALSALAFVGWWTGVIAGGADAKAIAALAFLLPFPLALGRLPLYPSNLPASLSLVGDGLLAFLLVPLGLLVYNVAHAEFRMPHALLGLRVPVERIGSGAPMWPMERVEAGRARTVWLASRGAEIPAPALRAQFEQAGMRKVWVTPKVPFLLALFVGFLASFLLGDVLTAIIRFVLIR